MKIRQISIVITQDDVLQCNNYNSYSIMICKVKIQMETKTGILIFREFILYSTAFVPVFGNDEEF